MPLRGHQEAWFCESARGPGHQHGTAELQSRKVFERIKPERLALSLGAIASHLLNPLIHLLSSGTSWVCRCAQGWGHSCIREFTA